MLGASYEAEQHLLHFGRSDVSVCWTICGLISGYLSRATGDETGATPRRQILPATLSDPELSSRRPILGSIPPLAGGELSTAD